MKRTLNILLILGILAVSACKKSQDNQQPLNFTVTMLPGTFPTTLTTLKFADNNVGYVADYAGHIYKTTDAGQNWAAQTTGETNPVNGLWFLNATVGYAVGGETSCNGAGCIPPGGYVLQTTDGGQSWQRIYSTPKYALYDVCFTSAVTGYAIDLQNVYKTTDGGKTWTGTKINIPSAILTHITFADALHGYIVTSKGYIIVTADGGNNWQNTSTYPGESYNAIAAGPGYAYAGGSAKIVKSVDNGQIWALLGTSADIVNALYFADTDTGISFGMGTYTGGDWGFYRTAIYTTTNGGQTWNGTNDGGDFSPPKAVSFPSKNIGYGVTGSRVFKVTIQ